MSYTDWLLLKLVLLAIAAFFFEFFKAARGLPEPRDKPKKKAHLY